MFVQNSNLPADSERALVRSPRSLQEGEDDGTYNEIYVWGDDSKGQLGLCGQFSDTHHLLPKICSFNVVIKGLSCGDNHTVFFSDSGHVYSMGDNSLGQLGFGDRSCADKNLPCLVESLVDEFVCSVKCGAQHSLALSESGTAFAWGSGKNGQLGNGRSAA